MTGHIRFISAGAGSGKTYRITEELQNLLATGDVRPAGVIATTFTRKAATELRERVRQKLMADGHVQLAAQMGQALIGTVNGICGQLLARFSFEAGLSPEQKVLDEEQGRRLFGEALEGTLVGKREQIAMLNDLAQRLGKVAGVDQPGWRSEVMQVASASRSNNMTREQLESWGLGGRRRNCLAHFPPPYSSDVDLPAELFGAVEMTIKAIDTEVDTTKATANYPEPASATFARDLRQEKLQWSQWVKLSKSSPRSQEPPGCRACADRRRRLRKVRSTA